MNIFSIRCFFFAPSGKNVTISLFYLLLYSEAALLRGSYEKLFQKNAANLQKNTQGKM